MKISKKFKMKWWPHQDMFGTKSQLQEQQDAENGMSTRKRNIMQISI
jgi:hypothetical protein